MTSKIRKTEMAGAGMMLQLLGVILMVVGFFAGGMGFAFFGGLGLLLLIYGGIKANVIKCSDCLGKVEKEARVCPHCRAEFRN
jgi:membrane-bound ClpP family serine protease